MSTNFLGGGVVLDEAGRPLDQIVLTGISATGYHGVFEHERREGQTFTADVVVHLDTRRAAATDDLARTADYGALAEAVAGVLAGEPADLVETVAERIAATALADPTVAAVDVAVHKPQAPITVPFDDVVVRVHRDRHKLPAAEPWRRPAGTAAPRPAEGRGTPDDADRSGASAPAPAAAAVPGPASAAPSGTASQPTRAAEHPDRLDYPPAAPVEAVLALGGNLGSAQSTLREAVADIERIGGVEILAVSPLARTAAVGGPAQPDFLNAVVVVRTTLAPRALLHAAQAIEQRHGRERLERWGPRTLDIDLITYGSTLAVAEDLELPHPRAHQRAFVLQPWAQIAPDAVLPGLGGGPVAALAATAPDRDGVRWLALDWMTAALPLSPREHAEPPAGSPGPGPSTHAQRAHDVDGQHAADRSVADRSAADGSATDQAGPDAWEPEDAAAPDAAAAPDDDAPGGDASADDAPTDDAPDDDAPGGDASADDAPTDDAPDDDAPGGDAPADDAPAPTRGPDGPLDWLPALPSPGASGTPDHASPARSPIFSPVVAPDDVPHPGDRPS